MNEKYVKVDDIVEYCNTYSACLQNKGQGVAQATLRRVKEFAKENAAEVIIVKHGEWGKPVELYGVPHRKCSHCTYAVTIEEAKEFDFCPKCGARMDGDTECR